MSILSSAIVELGVNPKLRPRMFAPRITSAPLVTRSRRQPLARFNPHRGGYYRSRHRLASGANAGVNEIRAQAEQAKSD